MNILYISNYLDQKYFQKIFNEALVKPSQNMQKFNNLVVEGLNANSEVKSINVISCATVNRSVSKKIFWKGHNIKKDKIKFNYIPFINLKFIKQICLAICSFFMILFWCLKNYGTDAVLISDGFYPVVSTISNILCKLFGMKIVSLYTDLTKYDINDLTKKKSLIRKLIKSIINIGDSFNVSLSDSFILLTDEMSKVINKKHKPYIVMEGLVDSEFKPSKRNSKNVIMYAGGLYEKYGVKMLIDAFLKWNNPKYELWLFGGEGDLISYIKSLEGTNVKYFGTLPNEEIVKMEKESCLLVNPRFTNELYTKYSFPSKNMEYMLSGTPVLTTKLPGMPKEYIDYVYLIEEETEEGVIKSFKKVFKNSKEELNSLGKKAQEFVLKEKNNKVQGEKIVNFIQNKVQENEIFGTLVYNFITLFCAILMLLGMLLYDYTYCRFGLILYFAVVGIISLVNYKEYLPYIFFLISFFTFTLGQYIFPNINGDSVYYLTFSNTVINRTMFMQFTCLFFSFLGYRAFLKHNFKIKVEKFKFKVNKNALKLFKIIVCVGFIITLSTSLLVNIEMTIQTLKHGYLSLYDGTFSSIFPEIFQRLATYLFIFYTFFVALCKNKKYIIIASILFLLNGVIIFVSGVRFELIFNILFFIFFYLLYHINNKLEISKKVKKLAILAVILTPFLLIGLNLYTYIRNGEEVNNFKFTEQIQSFFAFQGRSVNIINYAQIHENELTNEETQYVFGLFNRSLNTKINSLTLNKLNLPILSEQQVNLGAKISYVVLGQSLVEAGNGLGSQFLAELYLEGGIWGIILYSLFLGFIVCLFYQCSTKGFIYLYYSLALLNPLLSISRSVSFELFAPFLSFVTLSIIALFLIINFIYNKFTKLS